MISQYTIKILRDQFRQRQREKLARIAGPYADQRRIWQAARQSWANGMICRSLYEQARSDWRAHLRKTGAYVADIDGQ